MFTRIFSGVLFCLLAAGPALAQQGAQSYKRVTSMVRYGLNSGVASATDSFTLRYHGEMASRFSALKFSSNGWGYGTQFTPVYSHQDHVLSPPGLLDAQFDTLWHYQIDPVWGASWYQLRAVGWSGGSIESYDAAGYGMDYFRFRTQQVLNSQGAPSVIYSLYQQSPGSGWDTASVRYLAYDAGGRLARDSTYHIDPLPPYTPHQWGLKYEYVYRPDGRLHRMNTWTWYNGGWVESNGLSYFYDGAGRLTMALSGWLRGNTTVTDSAYRNIYEYTAGKCSLFASETHFGPGNWIRLGQQQLYHNSAGLADSMVGKYNHGIGNNLDVHVGIRYDGDGYPANATHYRVQNGQPEPESDSIVYRYESYLSNGIRETAGTDAVRAFPNPVRGGRLYLRWSEVPLHTSLQIELIGMNGQCLRQSAATASYPLQPLDFGDLPPGTYVLRIGAGGEMLLRERITVE